MKLAYYILYTYLHESHSMLMKYWKNILLKRLKHVFLKMNENINFYLHLSYKVIVIVQTIIRVTNNSVVNLLQCLTAFIAIFMLNCNCMAYSVLRTWCSVYFLFVKFLYNIFINLKKQKKMGQYRIYQLSILIFVIIFYCFKII